MKETEKTDSTVAGDECITAVRGEGWHGGADLNEGSKRGLAERVIFPQRPQGM